MKVITYFPVLEARRNSKIANHTTKLGVTESSIPVYNLPSPFYLSQPRKQKRSKIGPSTTKNDGTILSSAVTTNQLEKIYQDEKREKSVVPAQSQIKPCNSVAAQAATDLCDIKVKKLKRSLPTIFD